MRTIRGILHVHSRHSFDSEVPLESVVDRAKKSNLQFVCITEHTNELDEMKFNAFLKDCRRLSSPGLLLIPGLEITCEDGTHLLAFGLEKWPKSRKIEEILAAGKAPGVLYVLAHPLGTLPEVSPGLHGIEVWNRKYHGLLSPQVKVLNSLLEARKTNPALYGYGGVDHHSEDDLLTPITVLDCDEVSTQAVLRGLSAGKFQIRHSSIRLPADGSLSFLTRLRLRGLWTLHRALFGALKWAKWNMIKPAANTGEKGWLEGKIRNWL